MAEPTKRNAASLHQRVDELVQTFIQRYQSVLQHAREDENTDYSQTAQKELLIKEDAMAIVTTAQNTSMLIRELQELWLFGSLDTLTDPADEEADKAKAMQLARLIETLAKKAPEPSSAVGVPSGVDNGAT